MKIEIVDDKNLDSQFRSIGMLDDGSIVLAGGLDPLSGSRSAFRAEVCRFDLSGQELWRNTNEKSKHYTQLTISGQTILALIPHNFTRTIAGAFLFDQESGARLLAMEVTGIQHIASGSNGNFIVSVEDSEMARAIQLGRNKQLELLSWPSTDGYDLLSTTWISDELLLATFMVCGERTVNYEHHAYSLDSMKRIWSIRSKNDRVMLSGAYLITHSSSGACRMLEAHHAANGIVEYKVKVSEVGIERLHEISNRRFVWVNERRELVAFDATTNEINRMSLCSGHSGWIDLAASSNGQIAVIIADNHQHPVTRLVRCAVDW